jgi:hypothetical protein
MISVISFTLNIGVFLISLNTLTCVPSHDVTYKKISALQSFISNKVVH